MTAPTTAVKPLRIGTSFSGGFGSVEFALKYENTPHEVVFACEWMDKQRESYIKNHGEPTSNFYKDIRDMDGTKYTGEIDIYHLSPPCQSYSLAGKRGGAADERGGLMFEAIKSIDEVQPKIFTIENVKGLLSSNGGEDWNNIMRDIKSLPGYTVTYGVINAKEQGTPQNRDRVFIVGFRADVRQMPFPEIKRLDKCLADILEDEVDDKYYLSEKAIAGFIRHKERMEERGNGFGFNPTDGSGIASSILTRAGGRPDDNFILDPLETGAEEQQDDVIFLVNSATSCGYEELRLHDSVNLTFPDSKTRRGRKGAKVAQTLDTACNQGVVVKNNNLYRVRRLTPRECARAQGDFNDMFNVDDFSDTKLYEFIGNAMDISTTRNLIKRILGHTDGITWNEPRKPSFSIRESQPTNLFELETE